MKLCLGKAAYKFFLLVIWSDKFLSEEHEYSVENEDYADNDKETVNHFPFADD